MNTNTYQFILDNLLTQRDLIKASKLYIEHQLSLPENHRVCHEEEGILQEQLDNIKHQYFKYGSAIKELQESRSTLISPGID